MTLEEWAAALSPEGEVWQEQALCAQTDPDSFYPDKGESNWLAKRVCMACAVRADCLDYAIRTNERFGIWGGLSEQERRGLRRPPFSSGIEDSAVAA